MSLPNLAALSLRSPPTGEFWSFRFEDYPDREWEQDSQGRDVPPSCPFTNEPIREDRGHVDVVGGFNEYYGTVMHRITTDGGTTFRIELPRNDGRGYAWYEARELAEKVFDDIETRGKWPFVPGYGYDNLDPESNDPLLEMRPSDVAQLLTVYNNRQERGANFHRELSAAYDVLYNLATAKYAVEFNRASPPWSTDDIVTDDMRQVVRDIRDTLQDLNRPDDDHSGDDSNDSEDDSEASAEESEPEPVVAVAERATPPRHR